MIKKVTLKNFKRFKDPIEFEFKPEDVTFLAGGNNSGKSTLLQALAVWEFARSVMEVSRGEAALCDNWSGQGVGANAGQFSPIAIPDFKYLWTNLKAGGGYSLRIRCDWDQPGEPPQAKHLEFGFSLAFDRLFVKPTASNLKPGEALPHMAYLPPFAGIGSREERMLPAARKRWIGRGLAGAVLRNLLFDLWQENARWREEARGIKKRIPTAALNAIRKDDPWEQLLQTLEEVFKTGLTMKEFNEIYHDSLEVDSWDGQLVNKKFKKKTGAPQKDIMVEGSGFLQWLSVYALALDKGINVLLLDEPDAHLHPALQGHLIQKLGQLARDNRKQVLLATHSTTILSETPLERIYRMEQRAYLDSEGQRVKLFVGLGSSYAPKLDQLKKRARLFLHEGVSDLAILQEWIRKLGQTWPSSLICWPYTRDRAARELLFDELKKEIPSLKALSLQDRDNYDLAQTKADLTFDSLPLFNGKGLGLRIWRRRNIENYLLHPAPIARASGKSEDEIQTFLLEVHSLGIPPTLADFTKTDCSQTLANTDGKEILKKNAKSVEAEFHVSYLDIAKAMNPDEIPDDARTLIGQSMGVYAP
jgi:predicted ATPase